MHEKIRSKVIKSIIFDLLFKGYCVRLEKNNAFQIFFGDEKLSISVDEICIGVVTKSLQKIKKLLDIDQIALLQQIHSTQGIEILEQDDQKYLFSVQADYLFTQRKKYGIGVVSADCLPIVLYDPITSSSAIIHAGWKGLCAGIFEIAIQDMINKIGIKPKNLSIYVGPGARSCCYEVADDFIDNFVQYQNHFNSFFIQKNEKIYCDSGLFIDVLARNLGIKQENIYTRDNVCTICTLSFCSYRRQNGKARRQLTMISMY